MDNAESFVKHVVGHVLETCPDDIEFFSKFQDKGLKERLDKVVNRPFARVGYEEAVEMLQVRAA